ncbi:MAG: protein translocase subunit SecD [Lachnospiraceae bacterium]|nr:protein translocase subunit SecD [Lachnospiraceae bacterium]
MTKRNSLICFILSIVLIAGLCFVSMFGIDKSGKGSAKNITQGLDLQGGVSITFEVAQEEFSKEDFEDTYRKMERRAYELSDEASIYKEGNNRITVEIPGSDNAQAVLDKLGKPGTLQFVTDFGNKEKEKVWFQGEDIKDAQPAYKKDENTGAIQYMVALEFTEEAGTKFAEVTGNNVGKILYIVYDGDVISSPYVQQKITGGEATVTGMESNEEAEELAAMIRIGSLKLELKEISSKVVGAKLGDDAISTSLLAGVIGIAFICVFMVVAYRVPGLAAGLALIAYTAMNLLALNGFDITLTLPGIAGVILSIGMAVDANVIIFARIKEELGEGVEVKEAIKTGFKKATSAILDGNITTLIAALVLMKMGTGPIQGFAKTLAYGIVISMITAMFVTRGLLYLLYSMGFNKASMYGVQKKRKTVDFIGKRWILLSVSVVIIVAGIAVTLLNVKGTFEGRESNFNLSVEFKGGVSTSVEFDKNYDIKEFNEKILPEIQKIVGDGDVLANAVTGTNEYVIRTKTLPTSVRDEINKMLVEKFGAIEGKFNESSVSATVSKEMAKDSVVAVSIAVVCMLIYIFIRFRDIRFASSAILCLVHDIVIVILFYAVSWTTVGNTFIACMLTILGYSINASIVVFDRIREKLKASGYTGDLKEVVNGAITDTLTRSIYTSLTTFVTVAALYVLGVTAMKEFALPLIVGIVAGAYSSVCVAGSLWYTMSKKRFESGKMRKKYLESLED